MQWKAPTRNFPNKILQAFGLFRIWLFNQSLDIAGWFGILWFHSGSLYELVARLDYFVTALVVKAPVWNRIIGVGLSLLSPVFFLGNVGIYHYLSTLLGGRGQFSRYAYLLAAFGAPLTIVKSLLAFSTFGRG